MTSGDGATSEEDERDWSEWGDDDGDEPTKSLFSETVLPSAQQAIAFDAREHNFDVRQFRSQVRRCQPLCLLPLNLKAAPFAVQAHSCLRVKQNNLSDYDTVRCINYIRAEVAAGRFTVSALSDRTTSGRPWQKDEYMHPTLPQDPLLFYDFDDDTGTELDR